MNIILTLMAVFAKVALGAFGGGLATIPFIHYELVVARPWLTETMFRDTIALAQMTPGPIALNSATFVGYRLGGFWGSLWATVALVGTPILVISFLLWLMSLASKKMRSRIDRFQKALRPAVAGMLVVAFWTLAKPLIPSRFESFRALAPELLLLALVGVCFVFSRLKLFRSYPQLIILLAAVVGLCCTPLLQVP
ncbi:MAG: chromate transporter [Fretibacterium sp.]|nr:chromate transporter [Fretibacterium sp.]